MDGFGRTEVIGCRAVCGWERRSPFSAQPVGQHMKDWFFVGVGEEKIAVFLEQSWGSEEGEYTVK